MLRPSRTLDSTPDSVRAYGSVEIEAEDDVPQGEKHDHHRRTDYDPVHVCEKHGVKTRWDQNIVLDIERCRRKEREQGDADTDRHRQDECEAELLRRALVPFPEGLDQEIKGDERSDQEEMARGVQPAPVDVDDPVDDIDPEDRDEQHRDDRQQRGFLQFLPQSGQFR
ncbi:MAG: hypothetical protein AUI33_05645 [Ignavibacteria bacterium 13_1_40CM_2_61_4]|nr:MAG: hypothetical protein AUI33_05645 [Ignavibacteria bacterium 13_1_40CM_2_61_4]